MYALVDGNNFYVSCERAFRASLNGQPVVVLSNNDGCAIARSNEAKALGITMGAPWFEIRHFEESHGLVALSANFELYGDMSDRMMSVVAGLGHRQEVYSIDESFVDLSGIRGDLTERARRVRQRILMWTGIPCGIGIGQTKTLAKLANFIAKTAERKPGSYPEHLAQICNLGGMSAQQQAAVMETTDVGEVWGVGPRIGAQLREAGVKTVQDLVQLDPASVRRRWSVVLERTVRELQGVPCIEMEDEPPPKQEIAYTRSFGSPVTALRDLQEAVTEFASRAAVKLRGQAGHTGRVLVFIRTSPFRTQDKQHSASTTVPLRRPTDDSLAITQAALVGLRAIYQAGHRYAKAGVILLELAPAAEGQQELDFGDPQAARGVTARPRLMQALDLVNNRYGRGTLILGSAGLADERRTWSMKQERRTPRYTTRWEDMPVLRA
ncbi:MAG: Y-family DNA polymerase [Hylemonella sp.]|nr:Y-family DNA polymerase [Hylemonella sp.]